MTAAAEAQGEKEATRRVRRAGRGAETGGAILAAVLAMAAYCIGSAGHGIYPFGPRGRAINDLGNQFIPLHAHLWDLVHGAGGGDLFLNWNSGFGVPFLADFFTYLAYPSSWLVLLFARSAVDLPVFLGELLCIGSAAALMTGFLRRLRPGSPWLRAQLGAGYGVCAWALNDASSDPMWMWGLAALPLLCTVMDWALQRRRWVTGCLLVAMCWYGNFYTAAMASLCAILVLPARMLMAGQCRAPLRILLRAGSTLMTGVALAAPVLLVCRAASRDSQPPQPKAYHRVNPFDFLAQLLPAGRNPHSVPYMAIGMLGLVLLLSLPFLRAVPLRERCAWLGLIAVVAASFAWKPTVLLWHGLALPNGSHYRAAFVLSALMTMAAWSALARRPGPLPLLGGSVLLLVLALITASRPGVHRYTWISLAVVGSGTVSALLALHLARGRRLPTRAAGTALAALVFLGLALSAYAATVLRDQVRFYAPLPTMNAQSEAARTAVLAAETWPEGRSDPGPHQFADNDPLLVGGRGGSYYSSYVPAGTAHTLRALGLGWYMHGRHLLGPGDDGSRALFGVTSYLAAARPTHSGFVQRRTGPAAPLVTVHPADTTPGPGHADNPFALQNLLLKDAVWNIPAPVPLNRAGVPAPARNSQGWSVPAAPQDTPQPALAVRCPAGSKAYLDAPWFAGRVHAPDTHVLLRGAREETSNRLQPLGTVPASGSLAVAFSATTAQTLPPAPVGCLSPSALAHAASRLRATGAITVTAGRHTMSARLPRASTGTAVFAITAVPGWSCSVDGAAALPGSSYHGLLAAPLGSGATRVSCSYWPPGLTPGLAVTAAALLTLIVVSTACRLQRPTAGAASGALAPRTRRRSRADQQSGHTRGR
ncbi:YfhO family protein [Streptomyces lydicus]|uniref:YfhO family protein n=1 Tax=Streptomyces lydicus TaxID=47763 RepID=UPI0037A82088